MSAERKKDEAVSTDEEDRMDSLFEIEEGTLVRFDDGAYVTRFKGALPAVYVPASATRVGEKAFALSHVESVRFLGDVAAIGREAFSGCESLRDIVIPDTVSEIGKSAFLGCKALRAVDIRGPVEKIEECAFSGCASLSHVSVPASLATICAGAFRDCPSLDEFAIGEGAKRLELDDNSHSIICNGEAFEGSRGKRIVMPKSLEYISPSLLAFFDEAEIDPDNPSYKATDGDIYSRDGATLVACMKKEAAFAVPQNVRHIGEYAFFGRETLEAVTLPEGLETVGKAAFSKCARLKSVSLPASLASIGEEAFSDCASLERADVPAGVPAIEEGVFFDCHALKSVTLREGIREIGVDAFCNCSSLVSVNIPQGVESIGLQAFEDCASLPSVEIPSTVKTIEDMAFWGCRALRSVSLAEGVEEIGSLAFIHCASMESLTLPSSLKSIGSLAFANCVKLSSLTVPAGVEYLGARAFANCRAMRELVFEDPADWTYEAANSRCDEDDEEDEPEYLDIDPKLLRDPKRARRITKINKILEPTRKRYAGACWRKRGTGRNGDGEVRFFRL